VESRRGAGDGVYEVRAMIEVSTVPDGARPTVMVTTQDASGTVRKYRISLGPEMVDDERVMGGRRVDVEADGDRIIGPSQRAWDAARDHFEGDGHDVF
jgi:hypothetical protein